MLRVIAALAVLAVVAAACGTGEDDTGATPSPTEEGEALPTGGTLLLASVSDVDGVGAMDPQKSYYSSAFELHRCCINRTLLSYNGKATEEEGTEVFPDLADGEPAVSDDLLTWTFTIKQGINYSPPLEDVEVTAQDFVRAIERVADPEASTGGYPFYYSPIEGFDDFSGGDADSISGLTVVDDHTLEVQLNAPAGETPYLFALPASAPIPPNPNDPDARLGIAEGHTKDYGRFQVGTGPYMIQGTDQLDFSAPARQQTPVSGYEPDRSFILVRNPSYDPATDDLRLAYVDEIEISIGGTEEDLAKKVDNSEVDLVWDSGAIPEQISRYTTDEALMDRFYNHQDDAVSYSSMNLLMPPFDDIHVRKAVAWVVNKDALRRIAGGPEVGDIAGHVFVDGVSGGLNADYDPYATEGGRGDLEKAKEEMAQSAYDTDGDGICDAPECSDVLTLSEESATNQRGVQVWKDSLEQIGITLDNKPLSIGAMYARCEDPASQTAFCPTVGWGKDFPDGVTFGPPLFGTEGILPGCCNYAFNGATAEQLEEWGYSADVELPENLDERLNECRSLSGDERVQCWADFDRYQMENVLSIIPRRFTKAPYVVSERLLNYTFSQFSGMPSLDHVALEGS
jgi:peptide/nickel transport system substrate-binding protein